MEGPKEAHEAYLYVALNSGKADLLSLNNSCCDVV